MEQQIRFATAQDGTRIAFASDGVGPALVKAANWLTHLEHDRRSPVWRHWLDELGRGHRLVRYDQRGCGLSDRAPEGLTLDAYVADLSSVIDAAGVERCALLGISQGAAVAISYAVRNPDRVTHLVLYGGFARGRLRRGLSPELMAESELLDSVIRVGWHSPNPAFRRVFTTRFLPGASAEQEEWFDELQRVSTTPEMAQRLRWSWSRIDVTDRLAEVSAPTLVAHAREDAVVPFEEGRLLATGIPSARFLPLESRNHLLLDDEPAWQTFVTEARSFLGTGNEPPSGRLDDLSARELEVLRLVALGLRNEEIAARLFLSVRTVERHLSNAYAKLRVTGKAARAAAAARVSREAP